MKSIVYNEDCMVGMKEYPDNYFDLAVVDPPYGISVQEMGYTNTGNKFSAKTVSAKSRDYKKSKEWDVKPDKSVFDEIFRVSKRQIIWGGNYFSDILPPSRSFVVWDKRVLDNMSNDFADCEYAWCNEDLGVARMFRFVWKGMLQGDMKNKQERFHPTEKPIQLYQWILRNYAKDGDKILDPFLGSGSSRIASYQRELDFVRFEIDKEYFDKQEKRFEEFTSQTSLFYSFEK